MNKKNQPKIKHHHYVQRAYLKNFACNKKKTFIWMMDKWREEIYNNPKKIKNCAQLGFFYPQSLELWLNKHIESDGIDAVKKLLKYEDFTRLTKIEKKNLIEWMFVQYIRTPEFIKFFIENINFNCMYATYIENNSLPNDFLEVFRSDNPDIQHLPKYYYRILNLLFESIRNKKLYDQTWFEKEWVLFKNNTTVPYFTSDNPVIVWKAGSKNISIKTNLGYIGTSDDFIPQSITIQFEKNIMHYIPLSPTIILLLSDENPFSSSIIDQYKQSEVFTMNKMIAVQSYRYIFSNENSFEHAFQTIEEIPECIKKEKRITSYELGTPQIFGIKDMGKLKQIIKHFEKIDEERKETIFDDDFSL